jgi:hypothetical protein
MHLGHSLLTSRRDKNKVYDFIYQKFKSRLTLTKANTSSHVGCLTLKQSVFASIPIYYMANILFSKNLFSQAHSNYQDLLVARGTERATKQAHPLQIMGDNLQAKN